MVKTNKRDAGLAARIKNTAELTGVSQRQVRRIVNGTCNNEPVLSTYMMLYEGENQLVKSVKELVKFKKAG